MIRLPLGTVAKLAHAQLLILQLGCANFQLKVQSLFLELPHIYSTYVLLEGWRVVAGAWPIGSG